MEFKLNHVPSCESCQAAEEQLMFCLYTKTDFQVLCFYCKSWWYCYMSEKWWQTTGSTTGLGVVPKEPAVLLYLSLAPRTKAFAYRAKQSYEELEKSSALIYMILFSSKLGIHVCDVKYHCLGGTGVVRDLKKWSAGGKKKKRNKKHRKKTTTGIQKHFTA